MNIDAVIVVMVALDLENLRVDGRGFLRRNVDVAGVGRAHASGGSRDVLLEHDVLEFCVPLTVGLLFQ